MTKIGIISTAANPLHAGHLAMAEWGDKNGYDVIFEIPSINADKGEIPPAELSRRKAQFHNIYRTVISTDRPNFITKEFTIRSYIYNSYGNYHDLYFFVGYDTILRVDNVKYYYGSTYERDRLFNIMKSRFIVFERNGKSDLSVLSEKLRNKCELATNYQSINISSTELRNA